MTVSYTHQQLSELSQQLTEQLDVCTIELVDFIHKQTGKRLEPSAIDWLRNRVAWRIALSCVVTIEHRLPLGITQ